MVDVKGQRLVDPTTYTSLPLQVTNASAHGIHNVAHDNNFTALLTEFLDILTPTFSNPTSRHGVVHYIPTDGPPIHSCARRLPPEKLAIACDEFCTMEWVLLGIHTAPKEDLCTSSAELVYGAPLTVPGDFVAAPNTTASPDTLLHTLHSKVQGFMLVPTSQHGTQSSSVPSDLHSSLCLCCDCHRSPLERPYEGPFRVITSSTKVFTIERGGKLEIISIDRLKPAHLDFDMPVPTPTSCPRGRPQKRP